MEYNFVWTNPSAGAPIVSIASYGITFNSATIEMLKKPRNILIGFDTNAKVIGVKPIDDETNPKAYDFAEKERKGYIRIGNRDLIKYISSQIGIDYSKSIRYLANWDENEQILIVDLMKPLNHDKNES